MASRSPSPAPLAWPADGGGLHRFVGVSLLAHGLALGAFFHFWPEFPLDRIIRPLTIALRPAVAVPLATPAVRSARAHPTASHPGATATRVAPSPSANLALPPTIDAAELVARARDEIDTTSRRLTADPMFAPPPPPTAGTTPLARATARPELAVRQIGDGLLRVDTAVGTRYCLQRLPEAATRDIPSPVMAVPMACP